MNYVVLGTVLDNCENEDEVIERISILEENDIEYQIFKTSSQLKIIDNKLVEPSKYILRRLGYENIDNIHFSSIEELRKYANKHYYQYSNFHNEIYFNESDFLEIQEYLEDNDAVALIEIT